MHVSYPVHLGEQTPTNNQYRIWLGIPKSNIISEPEGALQVIDPLVYLMNAFPRDLYPILEHLQ